MEISFELKSLDHTDSALLASKDRRAMYLFDVTVAFGALGVGLLSFGFRHFLIGIALLALSWTVAHKRIYGWKTWKIPEESRQETVRVTFSEEAFEYHHVTCELRLPWSYFSHVVEDDSLFVLILRAKKTLLIVPKRAFADEVQLNEARRYFREIMHSGPIVPPIANPH